MSLKTACVLVAVSATLATPAWRSVAAPSQNRAPTTLAIQPPRRLAAVIVPKDAPTAPPADAWWKRTPACPDGARYEESEAHGRHTHRCLDERGATHGPLTVVGAAGKVERDAWYRHGKQHGLERLMIPQRADQAYMYVEDQKHGPADEYGDTGNYYRGRKHGLWKVVRAGSTPQYGHYVDDEREGVWLSAACDAAAPCVIARATYRRGQPTGTITWWTERGTPLATGRISFGETTWQFGEGKQLQVTLACSDRRATRLHVSKGREAMSCAYDRNGELASRSGGERGLGCPVDGAHRICEAEILDPYRAANAMNRIWQ